jgi:hypothetical protein
MLIGAGGGAGIWAALNRALVSNEFPSFGSSARSTARQVEGVPQANDGSPIGRLSELGWTVKPEAGETLFEISNKRLPDMQESAKYFRLLHRPFHLQLGGVLGIEGLHYLKGTHGCTQIGISAGEFTDLSELGQLDGLTKLVISQTPLSGLSTVDITPLSSLTRLEELNLFGTKVTDVSPLAKLAHLRVLYLKDTPVGDLSPLLALPQLEFLDVTGTRATDLSPLARADLKELHIDGKQVPDLPKLTHLKGLTVLNIISQSQVDLSPISVLANLDCSSSGDRQYSTSIPYELW